MPRGTPHPKQRLNKRFLDGIQSTNPRGQRYLDSDLNGFGVAVYSSGKKSFFVEFGPKGKRTRKSIGRYGILTPDQARAIAKKHLAQVTLGEDPFREDAELVGKTFEEWASIYLSESCREKKEPRHDRQYLGYCQKWWKGLPLEELSQEEIETKMAKMAKGGKKTAANRWLASLRPCLAEAQRRGLIETNPANRVRNFPENPPRQRRLDNEEWHRLLASIKAETDPFVKAAFVLLTQTGARKSEVLRARWEDFDFEAGTWTIPSPKAGHPQAVIVLPRVQKIILSLPRFGPFVFPGKQPDQPKKDLRRSWDRIRQRAKLEDVVIHDIRRTYGTQMRKSSGIQAASRSLRHSDIRVTQRVYGFLDQAELQKAAEERSEMMRADDDDL